jgi:hypothetical protein
MSTTKGPEKREKGAESATLSAQALALIEKLPADAKPTTLAEKYPRIMNNIADMWRRPDSLMVYFDELLVDTRGKRAGFPMSVALELASMKDYYEAQVHPERGTPYLWDPRRKENP